MPPPISIAVDKELVRILVINGKLRIPEDNHKIYYYNPRGPKNPQGLPPTEGRPNQLTWLVFGLPPEHKVVIEEKYTFKGRGYMPRDKYIIEAGSNPVDSGLLLKGPDPGQVELWHYNVTLLGPTGDVVDSYDPGVVIGNDP